MKSTRCFDAQLAGKLHEAVSGRPVPDDRIAKVLVGHLGEGTEAEMESLPIEEAPDTDNLMSWLDDGRHSIWFETHRGSHYLIEVDSG